MSTIYAELPLDAIHKTIETKLTALSGKRIEIYLAGQDAETAPTPFLMYTELLDSKYAEYQALKYVKEPTPGNYESTIELPTKTDIQYSVHFPAKEKKQARQLIQKFYLYLCSDEFQQTLDGAGFTIVSGVRPSAVLKDAFFERQYMFDVRWLWRDGVKTTGGATIEHAGDPTGGPVNDIS